MEILYKRERERERSRGRGGGMRKIERESQHVYFLGISSGGLGNMRLLVDMFRDPGEK